MARTTFRFRLQRLLDVRIMREKQAQQELQARRAQVAIEQAALVELQAIEQALKRDLGRPLERGEDIHEYAHKRAWTEKLIKANGEEQTAQRGKIAQAEQLVVEQLQVVKQCGIDVKALEKLEAKQREEHRLEQLREEGLFLDDLAGQGYLRRRTIATRNDAEDATRRAGAAAIEAADAADHAARREAGP